jgi:hypothetical protein
VALAVLVCGTVFTETALLSAVLLLHHHTVALAVLVCGTVLVRNARQAHHLRYSWREYPAMAPEMLLAAIKALAYG